jgi:hypothetical protein
MATSKKDKDKMINTGNSSSGATGASEEALKRSMAPLESRTAIRDKDEREEVNVENPQQEQTKKEEQPGEGFIDLTNDAGEIE